MSVDVLSQIFETAVDTNPSSLSTIRSVNYEWFEVAGNTPKLWSTLNLKSYIHFTDPQYVCLHLQNAGGIPLDVNITLHDDIPCDPEMPVISQLRQALHRIKSLTINAPYHESWQRFVSGIGEGQPAPLLERLVLKVKGDVYDVRNVMVGPFTTLSTALTPSPKLVHLQLPAWPVPAQPPPQLSGVTSLTFDTPFSGLDIPSLFPLIQAAPHLEHLVFKCVDIGESSPLITDPGPNTVFVPKLRSANVIVPGFGFEILGKLRAPLLTDLCLDGYRKIIATSSWKGDDWGAELTQPASAFLMQMSAGRTPNIRRLEIRYLYFAHPSEDFRRLLSGHVLPNLEELILEKTNITDAALIQSALGHSGGRLNKLELRNCKFVTVDGLRRFLQGHANNEFVLSVERCPAISQEDIGSLPKTVRVDCGPWLK